MMDPTEEDGDAVDDAELVSRCQVGDYDAYDVLVTRYRGKIYAMIYNMVRNDADAWDLAQEAFVKAWKALPKFKAQSNFYTWLYRIAHNVTYDWLRKKSNQVGKDEFDDGVRGKMVESPTTPREAAAPDESAERSDLRRTLDEALSKLSPDHREVILLKEVEGLQYNEIAERIEVTLGTVMSRLFYARKKLQEILKEYAPS